MGKSQKSTLVFDPVLRTFIDSSMKEKDNSIVCREIKSIPQKDWDKCIERCKDILKEADFRESRALRRVASMYLLLLCFSFRYITSVTDIIDGNLRSILRALVKNRAEAIQLTRSPASENAMAWFEWLLKNPPDAPNGWTVYPAFKALQKEFPGQLKHRDVLFHVAPSDYFIRRVNLLSDEEKKDIIKTIDSRLEDTKNGRFKGRANPALLKKVLQCGFTTEVRQYSLSIGGNFRGAYDLLADILDEPKSFFPVQGSLNFGEPDEMEEFIGTEEAPKEEKAPTVAPIYPLYLPKTLLKIIKDKNFSPALRKSASLSAICMARGYEEAEALFQKCNVSFSREDYGNFVSNMDTLMDEDSEEFLVDEKHKKALLQALSESPKKSGFKKWDVDSIFKYCRKNFSSEPNVSLSRVVSFLMKNSLEFVYIEDKFRSDVTGKDICGIWTDIKDSTPVLMEIIRQRSLYGCVHASLAVITITGKIDHNGFSKMPLILEMLGYVMVFRPFTPSKEDELNFYRLSSFAGGNYHVPFETEALYYLEGKGFLPKETELPKPIKQQKPIKFVKPQKTTKQKGYTPSKLKEILKKVKQTKKEREFTEIQPDRNLAVRMNDKLICTPWFDTMPERKRIMCKVIRDFHAGIDARDIQWYYNISAASLRCMVCCFDKFGGNPFFIYKTKTHASKSLSKKEAADIIRLLEAGPSKVFDDYETNERHKEWSQDSYIDLIKEHPVNGIVKSYGFFCSIYHLESVQVFEGDLEKRAEEVAPPRTKWFPKAFEAVLRMNRRYGYIHHDIFVRKLAKIIKGSIRIENAWNTVRYYMRDLGFEEALRDTTKIRKDNYKEFLERS